MLLFVNPSNMYVQKIIIPLERVFDIVCSDSSIIINYDSGEMINVEGHFEHKIESARITYGSEDEVNKAARQFYKACNAGGKAFYFGLDNKVEKVENANAEVENAENVNNKKKISH